MFWQKLSTNSINFFSVFLYFQAVSCFVGSHFLLATLQQPSQSNGIIQVEGAIVKFWSFEVTFIVNIKLRNCSIKYIYVKLICSYILYSLQLMILFLNISLGPLNSQKQAISEYKTFLVNTYAFLKACFIILKHSMRNHNTLCLKWTSTLNVMLRIQ